MNVAQAVVTAVAAAVLEAGHASGQVQFIVGDENLGRRDAVVGGQCLNRAAAAVHEGVGLEQQQSPSADADLGQLAAEAGLWLEAAAKGLGDAVGEPETGVVSGGGVAGPGIAEAGHEPDCCVAHRGR